MENVTSHCVVRQSVQAQGRSFGFEGNGILSRLVVVMRVCRWMNWYVRYHFCIFRTLLWIICILQMQHAFPVVNLRRMTEHKSSGAERQRIYIARLKENTTRYAAAKAKDRQRWKRRQTEDTKSDEAVRQQRKMCRERKQRSRERKRAREAEVRAVDIHSSTNAQNHTLQ